MSEYEQIRSDLKIKAIAEPGDTARRRAYYNLLEMTESYDKSSDEEQRRRLKANIEREISRLGGLSH